MTPLTTKPDNDQRLSDAPPVLEFRDVSIRATSTSSAIENASFRLCAGERMLVRLNEGFEDIRMMPAALGLLDDQEGAVRFQGREWTDRELCENERRRGLVGRVFRRGGWITNLSVSENVLLAQLHHTRRPEREIRDAANQFASQLGLPPVPDRRPAELPTRVVRCYQWVRAMYAKPALLLLEQPMDDVIDERLDPLVDAVVGQQRTGTAVLWLTTDDRVWRHPALTGPRRFRMQGLRLVPATEEDRP